MYLYCGKTTDYMVSLYQQLFRYPFENQEVKTKNT